MLKRKDKATCPLATDSSPYRLPRKVLPTNYELTLTPNLEEAKFSGREVIDITVTEPVSEIVLNAAELKISQVEVSHGSGTKLSGKVSFDDKTERATISFNGLLGKGDWKLSLKIKGTLNDQLRGFYRSTYEDNKGNKHFIATTQFESTDARRAFACFDEPDFKGTFKVTMIVDEGLTAISNTKITSQQRLSGDCKPGTRIQKQVDFARTIKMSTYIAAFIAGEFDRTEVIQAGSTEVSVYCRRGLLDQTKLALKAAKFGIEFLEKYFGIKYAGDKIDLIAIPDFAAGAMENLGCITFRETSVVIDELTASQSKLINVVSTVHHELVHMWFGDLVTMKWWNGLWLNEAFATFVQQKVTDAFCKEWAIWDKFGIDRGRAMKTDALLSTRPIEFEVVSPDDAQAMFDVLTYEKGASVLRMLEQFLSEETFRRGISDYLHAHAYGNAETTDLWDALQSASGKPVRDIMQGWVFNSGFPVILVSDSENGQSINMEQRSFKYLPEAIDKKQLWSIPLKLRGISPNDKQTTTAMLSSPKSYFNANAAIANSGGHGFFRVLYSDRLLGRITADLSALSVIERFNLVSDYWACTMAGLTSATKYIELIKLFADEQDVNVWTAITGSLSTLSGMLPSKKRAGFQSFVTTLLKPTMDRLGWTPAAGEDTNTRELRARVIETLGKLTDDKDIHKQAGEVFESYLKDPSGVDADLASAVISLVAHFGGKDEYKALYKLYKNAKSPQDQDRYLNALAMFADPKLLKKTLDLCLGEVRTQDAPYLVRSVMTNPEGSELAWEFIKDNWKKLTKLYPDSGTVAMCAGVSALSTPKLEKDVRKFFKSHPVKTGDKAIAQYLELLHVGVVFDERESANLAKYF